MSVYSFIVLPQESFERIDKILVGKFSDISRSTIQKLIKTGRVHVINGCAEIQVVDCALILKEGEIIRVCFELSDREQRNFVDSALSTLISLDIVYEDDHVLVINKAAGLVVHPTTGFDHTHTLVSALIEKYGAQFVQVGSAIRPGIVHRLDKQTSGLMIVAKTNEAYLLLNRMIEDHTIEREYLAIVYGVLPHKLGTISSRIKRSTIDRTKMQVVGSEGKLAITHYKVLEDFCQGAVSLVKLTLETGKTHQIRLHMSSIKHPLIGDRKYKGGLNFNLKALPIEAVRKIENLEYYERHALHSYQLQLKHPITTNYLRFTLDLPQDMKEILEILRIS